MNVNSATPRSFCVKALSWPRNFFALCRKPCRHKIRRGRPLGDRRVCGDGRLLQISQTKSAGDFCWHVLHTRTCIVARSLTQQRDFCVYAYRHCEETYKQWPPKSYVLRMNRDQEGTIQCGEHNMVKRGSASWACAVLPSSLCTLLPITLPHVCSRQMWKCYVL